MKKDKAQINSDADIYIADNTTQDIDASDVRDRIKDIADSFLNLTDGGLVIDAELGYSTPITPSSNYSFATKKYADDLISAISLAWGSITGTITNQTDLINYLVSNYVSLGGSYANPTWITSLNYAKITGGTSAQFVKANGSLDSSTYLTSESDTLATVTTRGATTSNVISLTGANVNNLSLTSSIKIGGNTSSALSAGAGSLRYSSGLQVSDGTNWNSISTMGTLTNTYMPYWNGSSFVDSLMIRSSDGESTQSVKRLVIQSGGTLNLAAAGSGSIGYGTIGTTYFGLIYNGIIRLGVYGGNYSNQPIIIGNLTSTTGYKFQVEGKSLFAESIKIGNTSDTAATAGSGSYRWSTGPDVSDGSSWLRLSTKVEEGGYIYFDKKGAGLTGGVIINLTGVVGSYDIGQIMSTAKTIKEIQVMFGVHSASAASTVTVDLRKINIGTGGQGSAITGPSGSSIDTVSYTTAGVSAASYYVNARKTGLSHALAVGDMVFCYLSVVNFATIDDIYIKIRVE